ncbi:MAG: hypothetical protein IKU63_02625 [Bacteroidaceae bacterium]|nr:hypothetical protein [Bacteroidaceae bacterium]
MGSDCIKDLFTDFRALSPENDGQSAFFSLNIRMQPIEWVVFLWYFGVAAMAKDFFTATVTATFQAADIQVDVRKSGSKAAKTLVENLVWCSLGLRLPCTALALPKIGFGSAGKRKTSFPFALHSPCTIFAT